MIILAFHTATTGMIDYKARSHEPQQPHIVRLAAILYNTDTNEVEQTLDVIIKPDGWVCELGAVAIHGITDEMAMAQGIPEKEALEQFLAMYKSCDLRVAHSINSFDNRIIRIALQRYLPDLVSDEQWKDKSQSFCTMTNAEKDIPGGKKNLGNVYEHYIGATMARPDDTMQQVQACLKIYGSIKDMPIWL